MTLLICMSLFAISAQAKQKVTRFTFKFNGKSRFYYAFTPDRKGPLPLVVLLHGPEGNGNDIAHAWKGLAANNHFIIVAPDALDPWAWNTTSDPPAFFHAVVERVEAMHPVDKDRMYLYGYRDGGAFALALALLDSEYFAASVANADALGPQDYEGLFTLAKRKMPVGIWVGIRYKSSPEYFATATRKEFETHGFPVEFHVIPVHDRTNPYGYWPDEQLLAWDFLRRTRLSQSGGTQVPTSGQLP
jgi:pimeloyl-ACP methyl ester carboxylesterase